MPTNYEIDTNPADFYASEAKGGVDEQVSYGVVSPDLLKYCKNIENVLAEMRSTEKEEDRAILIANVFEQFDGNELVAVTDGDCSRVIEKLLRYAPDYFVVAFADKLSGSYPDLFRHQFASHVCQTILNLGLVIVHKEQTGKPIDMPDSEHVKIVEDLPKMTEIITEICNQLNGQWGFLAKNQYASHVVRTLIHVLAGQVADAESSEMRSKKSRVYNYNHRNLTSFGKNPNQRRNNNNGDGDMGTKYTVPESFTGVLDSIIDTLINDTDGRSLRAMAVNSIASPVIQLVLKFRPNNELIKTLLDINGYDHYTRSGFVSAMITDKVGSHLLEKIIPIAEDDTVTIFYNVYIKSDLMSLVQSPTANFVIQRLIGKITDAEALENIVEQLGSKFEQLIKENRQGVVHKLIERACTLDKGVDSIIDKLAQSLGVSDRPSEFVTAVLYLNGRPGAYSRVKLQGSLILQSLCKSKSQRAINALLDGVMGMDIDTLINLCRDATASRFIEAMFTSQTVPAGAQKKLARKMLRNYGKLAADKYGSHIVDKCWAVADPELRELIAEDLEKSYSYLVSSMYGKFIIRNFNIETFKRNRKEWVGKQTNIQKKRKMFEDILQ